MHLHFLPLSGGQTGQQTWKKSTSAHLTPALRTGPAQFPADKDDCTAWIPNTSWNQSSAINTIHHSGRSPLPMVLFTCMRFMSYFYLSLHNIKSKTFWELLQLSASEQQQHSLKHLVSKLITTETHCNSPRSSKSQMKDWSSQPWWGCSTVSCRSPSQTNKR